MDNPVIHGIAIPVTIAADLSKCAVISRQEPHSLQLLNNYFNLSVHQNVLKY